MEFHGNDAAVPVEEMFDKNRWPSSWRNGIFGFHHYHSTAHEVLGVYGGAAKVQLGGEGGIICDLKIGDVVVIPAGVSHKKLSSTGDFRVVGAYPAGQSPDMCYPRYAARLVVDIAIGPSPFWIQDNLMSVGLRPINNIVDITNFVLMETGQPLHAFDFDRLEDNRIVVRTAGEGEHFTTLDQTERRLTRDMLMICDGKQPVAVGGVMGGMN